MELKFFLHETKNESKISFMKTNRSNVEIKYFEFDFPMINKNTKETLNKFTFQRRKNMKFYWSLRGIRHLIIQQTSG